MRRQLLTGLLMTIALTVLLGLVYPFVMTGIAQVAFHDRANGSLVKVDGKVVGSSLIGQNFALKDGSPDPRYFQPRPSAAGAGYDALASAGSNNGPTNANQIGNVPGVAIDTATGKPLKSNPYATPSDPYCVPVQASDKAGNAITDQAGNAVYEKNRDGTYVCDPNTVPQRVLAYRAFNGLSADTKAPVDAVTASGSGLDPDISLANARLQAARVARARKLPVAQVLDLVDQHTDKRQLGFLGETTVNVLDLNLALDQVR
jgi:potassium-transporting ATPase KdpC subunit